MGRLCGIIVDIEGILTIVDFEVIEIVDDINPYLVLFGLDWDFDNFLIINLRKRQMVFEKDDMRVIVLLDPSEGVCYTDLV